MINNTRRVKDAADIQLAIHENAKSIEVEGVIDNLPSLKLSSGTLLRGVDGTAELRFKEGQPGLILSANHRIADLRIVTDETQIAIGLADENTDLGTITVDNIRTVGRFHLEAAGALAAHIKLDDIHVERADARIAAHRPSGFGVEVLLGGLTVLNNSKNKASRWTLEAHNLSGGSKENPLRGSGIFIFGGAYIPFDADMAKAPAPTEAGGVIELTELTTGEIHSDGGIPKGTGNLITGGVFVGSGVNALSVINQDSVTTYSPNDMVLDNWGAVDSWAAKAPITSYGSSGIGFVNFGDINALKIQAPIETHGLGARGFNLYDGTLNHAEFQSITTFGDGAIGVQLSKPFGTITVDGDIRTKGGEGESLVRGKVVHLKAHAFSLKPGASGKEFKVLGQAIAENETVADFDFEAPVDVIQRCEIAGKKLGAS
ncbi:hypothetical protein [Ochrobactrum teleogrylli]|uniref:Uncharacterized protein n=1 Tax=Ochrobactrum teleogrylli TaxID=2479765 RepID=A0ABD5K2U0_9HYPH